MTKLDEAYEAAMKAAARIKASLASGTKPDPNDIYAFAQASGSRITEKAKIENAGPTAKEIAKRIYDALPEFHSMKFSSKQGQKLGDEDSVFVTYASVPANASELDAMNARTNPMFSIVPAPGYRWFSDGPSPAKVKIEMFRGAVRTSYSKFRARSGTPDQIIKYFVDFCRKNMTAFLS